MSHKRVPSLKLAMKCSSFSRTISDEKTSVKSPTFSSLVLLAMNLKKSPWLLSRCKKTHDHVQVIEKLVKESDSLKVIVKLTRTPRISTNDERYLVLISSLNDEKDEVNLLMGVNVMNNVRVTVGLILPITMETDICLDGDGGFFVSNSEKKYSFQPASIQEMWSALQALVRCAFTARSKKCQHVSYEHYEHLDKSDPQQVCEWQRVVDALSTSKTRDIMSCESKENSQLKMIIRRKLQEILVNVDLDTITSSEIRDKLDEKLKMNVSKNLGLSLSQYKQFIDEETILVMRQMDSPSQILDFLYLGSEWNASNYEELKRNRIGYILNLTKEIENYFPGMFKYCNVQVYDYEETELLKYWNNTYKFISEAVEKNLNVLVHCKMGISRSASTVIAFIMKYHRWTVEQAYQFVKQKRSCIQPNPGFMQQLITYQGILDASNHRHNKLFRSRSISSLEESFKSTRCQIKSRPKSNAEERQIKVDQVDKTLKLLDNKHEPSNLSSEKFIIVDADDRCLDVASESPMSLDAQVDVPIDESTLSTSSVLRQWSSQSTGGQQSIVEETEEIFKIEEQSHVVQRQNSLRKSCSWSGELDSSWRDEVKDVNPLPSTQRVPTTVRFTESGFTHPKELKGRNQLRRHRSLFQE